MAIVPSLISYVFLDKYCTITHLKEKPSISNMPQNNTWSYIKTDETDCVGSGCENKEHPNGTIIVRTAIQPRCSKLSGNLIQQAREYAASLWARKDEEIRFHIKFSKGSHVNFTWMLEESPYILILVYHLCWYSFWEPTYLVFRLYYIQNDLRRIWAATFLMLKRVESNANWKKHLLTQQPLR